MSRRRQRRTLVVRRSLLLAVSGASMLALLAGSARASTPCAGSNITGVGTQSQTQAQGVWTNQFNLSSNPAACNGTQGTKGKPTIFYTRMSDGAGLESWGINEHSPTFSASNAFVATDEPPTPAQVFEIEVHRSSPGSAEVETIPVAQESLAIIANLPSGCVATSAKHPGRLELNNVTLEKIFRGAIKKWSEITDDGDELSGAACNREAEVGVVVRNDQAGTTRILKKYLNLINPSAFEFEPHELATWGSSSQGRANNKWPVTTVPYRPFFPGEAEEIGKVESTEGSIGYASLAFVRNGGSFSNGTSGGPGTRKFWIPIQNNGVETTGKLKYADPAANEDVSEIDEANCTNTEYTNGEEPFPPFSTLAQWNEVTTRTIEKKYTLCAFTYVLALKEYGAFSGWGTNPSEALTVENFLSFVTESKPFGGQKLIEGKDYERLPRGKPLTLAQAGAGAIIY
jgi:ABC-type phosphate transport system substrate-binding protein